jgi:hypothetical protein
MFRVVVSVSQLLVFFCPVCPWNRPLHLADCRSENNLYNMENLRTIDNHEMSILCKDLDIVVDIRRKGLECLGHSIRMDKNRVVKKIFENKPEGIRKVGRPRLRLKEI